MKKLGKILAVGAAGAAAAAVVNAGRKKAEAETRRIADEEVKSRDYGEPVSYTHLDVYKRQERGSLTKELPGFATNRPFQHPYKILPVIPGTMLQ